jgi:PAS domain S-box-containing protein
VAAVSVNAGDWRREGNPDDEPWRMLGAITRWRLVVGVGALGLGLLLRPDVANGVRWSLLGAGWVVLCVVTGAYALLVRTKKRPAAQAWLQAIVDCVLITALAGATGGPDSQFVLFYVVVVLWAGVLLETTGGLAMAGLASTGYLCLAWANPMFEAHAWTHGPGSAPAPVPYSPALVGFLVLLGAIAGSLGGRARRTQQTLLQASREVERARLDTDVILEHLPSGVLTLDTTGVVLHYNKSAEEILGTPLTQVRGRACADAFGPGPKPLVDKIAITLEAGRPLGREEVTVTKRDGREVPVGMSTAFLFDEHGNRRGVIAVFADLSDFKAIEERARRSETLAAIGQLSAGIAHEIRNCLNPISGSVEYLQKELVMTGEGAHLMSLISAECERLNRFVTELLDYAREPRFHPQVVALHDILADAVDLARRHPAYRKDIALVLEDEGTGIAARLDREQFKRVLQNVLQNALEALDGPGRVTVRVRALDETRAAVEVADTGPGIPAEQLSRVSEPFFTTKHGGTGLGLAIASRIMERLGGKLRVASRPGEGTTFTLELERELALEHAA